MMAGLEKVYRVTNPNNYWKAQVTNLRQLCFKVWPKGEVMILCLGCHFLNIGQADFFVKEESRFGDFHGNNDRQK